MNDELIVRVLSDMASPSESEVVRVWRLEASQNEAYFQGIARVWTATAPPPRTRSIDRAFVRSIIEAAERRSVVDLPLRRTAAGPARRRGKGLSSRRRLALLAAAIAGIALGVRVVSRPPPVKVMAVWEADTGRPRTIALSDGSLVRIAPGGRLTQLESSDERRFSLRGRAFFAVAHDARHPFVVEAGRAELRVLGTRFEIAGDGAAVRAVVLEGRVALSDPHGSVAIAAGGVGSVHADRPPTVDYPADVRDSLAWPNGVLVFQATPLYQVAAEVSRQFGRTVTVADPAIRLRRITAWFGSEDFQEVMEAICQAAAVACTISDTKATIRAR